MAHEFETGMFVREVAWHGLGTVIQHDPSWEEALQLAGLDWEVREVPIYARLQNDSGDETSIATHKALYRDKDNQLLGVVGIDYEPVQNRHGFAPVKGLIEQGMVGINSAGSLRGGKRVFFNCKVIGRNAQILPGDTMEQYLLVAMGHDGMKGYYFMPTNTRTVCMNTLRANLDAADRSGRCIKFAHTSGITARVEALKAMIDRMVEQFVFDAESYRYLARKEIKSIDVEPYYAKVLDLKRGKDGVYSAKGGDAGERTESGALMLGYETPAEELDGEEKGRGKRQLAALMEAYESGVGQDLPGVRGTYWGALNGLTYWTDHVRGRNEGTRFESTNFGDSKRLRNRATEIALTA